MVVCGYATPSLLQEGASHTVKFEGDGDALTEDQIALLRQEAVKQLSIEDIHQYYDPSFLDDEDCPPMIAISAEMDEIRELYDDRTPDNERIIN